MNDLTASLRDQFKNIGKLALSKVYWTPTLRQIMRAEANLQKPESAILFTTHKCASTFVEEHLLKYIARYSDYDAVDYASAIWAAGNRVSISSPYETFLCKAYSDLYFARGSIYGPQRKPLDFSGRKNFKHLFFLRDPRDTLVSSYYSFAFTHGQPVNTAGKATFLDVREKAREQGIDEYVLSQAKDWILPLLSEYRHLRETAESQMFLSYDLFIEDTRDFLARICEFLNIEIPDPAIEKLIASASPVQTTEALKHRRSGKSGQFHEKLRPETVQSLNRVLRDALDYWEFPV